MFVWLALSGYAAAALLLLGLAGLSAAALPGPVFVGSQATLLLATLFVCGFAHPELRQIQSGFGRFCDALGGGYTRERVVRILRDRHPGVFATVGLTLIALLEVVLLGYRMMDLPGRLEVGAAVASAQLLPGFCALVHSRVLPTAPANIPPELSAPQPTTLALVCAALLCVPACVAWFVFQPRALLVAMPTLALFTAWFHFVVRRRLGHAAPATMASVVQIGRLLVLLAATAEFARVPKLTVV